jgi:uncharacterized metal-binding protein
MTNWIAVQLDRRGVAEMSCIAGVGGDVPSLVRKATSGRPIIAIDGCVLQCARNCLGRHDVTPTVHHLLSDDGVRKRLGEDFDETEAQRVLDGILVRLETSLVEDGIKDEIDEIDEINVIDGIDVIDVMDDEAVRVPADNGS